MKSRIDILLELPKNKITAIHIKELEKLAHENVRDAANLLGRCYELGAGGLTVNIKLAKKYYKWGIRNGETWPIYNLIRMLKHQMGEKLDWAKIAKLSLLRFKRLTSENLKKGSCIQRNNEIIDVLLANSKTRYAHPQVLHALGQIYFQGLVVKKDTDRALKYLLQVEEAVEISGFQFEEETSDFYYDIAKCYQENNQHEFALRYLQKAANKKHPQASMELAEACLQGRDIPLDVTKAGSLYQQVASMQDKALGEKAFFALKDLADKEMLNSTILNNLALCYRFGCAVERNLERAVQLCEQIVQIYHDKITDNAVTGLSLLNTYNTLFTYYTGPIVAMDKELLEKRRVALRKNPSEDSEAVIKAISLVLRCINKLSSADKFCADLNDAARMVPEAKHVMQYLTLRDEMNAMMRILSHTLNDLKEQTNLPRQIKFLGIWISGKPEHVLALRNLLNKSDINKLDHQQLFALYKEVIKFLSQIKSSRYRHPETSNFYTQSLKTLNQVCPPEAVQIENTREKGKEKATDKERKTKIGKKEEWLLDLSSHEEWPVSPLVPSSVPVYVGTYRHLNGLLTGAKIESIVAVERTVTEDAPPCYPDLGFAPSAPRMLSEADRVLAHQAEVETSMQACPSVAGFSLLADNSNVQTRCAAEELRAKVGIRM